MVQCWLSQALSFVGPYHGFIPSSLWRRYWEQVVDGPRYSLGAWMGYDTCFERWMSLSASNRGFEVATTVQRVPMVLPAPKKGESLPHAPLDLFKEPSHRGEDYRAFEQRLSMAQWFNIPQSDHGEMRVDVG